MYSSLKKISWISQLTNQTQFLLLTLSRLAARSRSELKQPLLMPKLQKTFFSPERMRTSALPKMRQQGSQTTPRMILVSLGSRLGQLQELFSLQTFLLSRETMSAYSSMTEVVSVSSCPEQQQASSALSVSMMRTTLEWPSMNWWKLVLWSRLYSQSLLVFSMSCFMWVSIESIRNFFSGLRFQRISPMKSVRCQTKLAERNLPVMLMFPLLYSLYCRDLASSFWSSSSFMSFSFSSSTNCIVFMDYLSIYSILFFSPVTSSSDRLASFNKSLVLLCYLTSFASQSSSSLFLLSAQSALSSASPFFRLSSMSQSSFSLSSRFSSFTLVFNFYICRLSSSCSLEDCQREDERVELRASFSELRSCYFFKDYSLFSRSCIFFEDCQRLVVVKVSFDASSYNFLVSASFFSFSSIFFLTSSALSFLNTPICQSSLDKVSSLSFIYLLRPDYIQAYQVFLIVNLFFSS